MHSIAYVEWTTHRNHALDEIASAHAAVGGTRPGRRYATQQVNHAYAVLVASQFQGFCRSLHSECARHLAAAITIPGLRAIVLAEWVWNRQLNRGNATAASIGSDFGRLDIDFWIEVDAYDPRCVVRRRALGELNAWRNAIAHQDFNPALVGNVALRLSVVRHWRRACGRLGVVFDEVMRRHVQNVTGVSPW
jgi:hypothetical protein